MLPIREKERKTICAVKCLAKNTRVIRCCPFLSISFFDDPSRMAFFLRARLAKFDWIERDTVSQHTSSRASFFSFFFPRTSAGGAFSTGKRSGEVRQERVKERKRWLRSECRGSWGRGEISRGSRRRCTISTLHPLSLTSGCLSASYALDSRPEVSTHTTVLCLLFRPIADCRVIADVGILLTVCRDPEIIYRFDSQSLVIRNRHIFVTQICDLSGLSLRSIVSNHLIIVEIQIGISKH